MSLRACYQEPMDAFDFTATLEDSGNNLWTAHVPVPDLIAKTLLAQGAKRVVCTLQGGALRFQCGLVPYGEGRYGIMVNKKLRDQLGIRPGSLVAVSLEPDNDPYGLPMPEELRAVLDSDPEGDERFHQLTPGKIRTMMYFVSSVKNSDKRIIRALTILEHIKRNNGKIDFKALNEELKVAAKGGL
jgi:Domain of unknown function (DUF1905)/Bacteriocin-protection, YdeI or OmpD-Associated